MLIFDKSKKNRKAMAQMPEILEEAFDIPRHFIRFKPPNLPEVSELQVVRHFTQLSQKNFSVDSHFYPLGSCTMKYNPRGAHRMASIVEFLARHPLAPVSKSQGVMSCLFELQDMLKVITGMQGVSLTPMAGAQGELTGVLMIRAYHRDRGDHDRTEMLVPDSAHGTNPASAVMCGYKIKEIPTGKDGNLDIEFLKKTVSAKTAGILLTNPSTLGVFEKDIQKISEIVHQAGALLYYDGANLNAILGKVRPGDMGFDVMHMNLHKTFATPHGGGGPGAGPIAVGKRLLPYLPIPMVGKKDNQYYWLTEKECPKSIGRLSAFMGNTGVLLRAFVYIRLLGKKGLLRVSEYSVLNANYLMKRMQDIGYIAAFPNRRAAHEFVITLKQEAKKYGVTAMDFAKRLLDFGCHAPTTYFPLSVPECWLIEPKETETKEELDHFIEIMQQLRKEMQEDPQKLKTAPHTLSVGRLDDVRAARVLDVVYKRGEELVTS